MIEFDRGPSKALAQHLADAPGYTAAQRKLFWYDWGPVFYRGRVRGTARLLGIASDPGPSIASTMPGSFQAVYNASKSFVQSFALALRSELKDTGVTVTR
jgi:NAD(P)-dependent dehydrogenase (short-subunit alcohol dehydrogenase family)